MKCIISFSIALCFYCTGFSQNIIGNWEGKLNIPGTNLPIIFHIQKDSTDKLTASFDSPAQKAYNIPCSAVFVKTDSLIVMIKNIQGKYAGLLSTDQKSTIGTWYQGAASFPLNLNKTSEIVTIKEFKRPQTPLPPFPYDVEQLSYENADGTIHFGATLTMPFAGENEKVVGKSKKYPVVLLITGSGQQDRDETIFGHKPFAVIADYLTRKGIAVLRVDDRGAGKTTGHFNTSTTKDFAADVEAGIRFLQSRKDIDPQQIGLLGHSEGGIIAPMVAAQNPAIAFIVLLAGPGIKITSLMEQQSVDVAKASGVNANDLAQYRLLYRSIVMHIPTAKDTGLALQKTIQLVKQWEATHSATTVFNTTGIKDDKSRTDFARAFVQQLSTSWFNYFIQINPSDYLTKVKCPVLALNGEKDIQVAAKDNLKAIQQNLSKNKYADITIKQLPGLNHLFQHCTKCSIEEYGDLEESFSTDALQIIGDWIQKRIH